MPQGGVEPPVARFLRPPRLPFRHCGDRPFTNPVLCAGFEPAFSFENGHLKPVRIPSSASRACCHSQSLLRVLLRASALGPCGLEHHLRGSLVHSSERRGKGSNLHPPASETGAESASASATHFSQVPRAGFEPAPKRRSF